MIANIVVELLYQVVLGILVYACYYYATFGYVRMTIVITLELTTTQYSII
jgi:hypothetical protein